MAKLTLTAFVTLDGVMQTQERPMKIAAVPSRTAAGWSPTLTETLRDS